MTEPYSSAPGAPYVVMVDENSHYMDETERYENGRYPDRASALAACRAIVDEFLERTEADTADELFRLYTLFGDDPFIVPDDAEPPFSAGTTRGPAAPKSSPGRVGDGRGVPQSRPRVP